MKSKIKMKEILVKNITLGHFRIIFTSTLSTITIVIIASHDDDKKLLPSLLTSPAVGFSQLNIQKQ